VPSIPINKQLVLSAAYDQHYDKMIRALDAHYEGPVRLTAATAEIRLGIAWRYRQQLPLPGVTVGVIDYWRHCFPRIDAEVRFQELRYTLALFPPKGASAVVRKAVLQEHARRDRHIDSNPRLYTYLRLDRHDQDDTLFGQDPALALSNSQWLATLWAFDRYKDYLHRRYPRHITHYAPLDASHPDL
jgi:hypothetical protein